MSRLINLLGQTRKQLESFFLAHGEKAFRATQLIKWIHDMGVRDFEHMTNFSKKLRHALKAQCEIPEMDVLRTEHSSDGTRKWLFHIEGGGAIETVYIPEESRATLCVSSQVGCALNCSFCHTAKQGFQKNLSSAQIIGQIWTVHHQLLKEGAPLKKNRPITNVVFMGMGEPLLNFQPVMDAIDIMRDDFAYGLSRKRVTVSTSGMVPQIYQMKALTDVSLALSLHAPNDELRSQLVPLNKKYPIQEVLKACHSYVKQRKRLNVTIEYVMLAGINDQKIHAQQLARLLNDYPCKINLIPFNLFQGTEYQCTPWSQIEAFATDLIKMGVTTTIRKTRGQDISGACGQLAGQVKDRTKRQEKFKRIQHLTTHSTYLTGSQSHVQGEQGLCEKGS